MIDKMIDFNKTVYDLCIADSNVAEILASLGFTELKKPGMIHTVGKFMTIPKGAAAKKIDIEVIKQEFIRQGYEIMI